jgi:hypothetical protein
MRSISYDPRHSSIAIERGLFNPDALKRRDYRRDEDQRWAMLPGAAAMV